MPVEGKSERPAALGRIALKRLKAPALTGDREVDRRNLLRTLSERFGLPALDLEQICIRLVDLGCIPRDLAEHHCLVPVLTEDDRVFVAMRNPSDQEVIHEVAFVAGRQVYAYVAPAREIGALIEAAYNAREDGEMYFVGTRCPESTLQRVRDLVTDGVGGAEEIPLETTGTSGADGEPGAEPAPGSAWDEPVTDPGEWDRLASGRLAERPLSDAEELVPREDEAPHRTVSAAPPCRSSLPPGLDGIGAAHNEPSPADNLAVLEEAFEQDQQEASAVFYPEDYLDGQTKTALVACQAGQNLDAIAAALTREGFRLRLAVDGREALQGIKQCRPDLLIVSAMLPVIHGLEVARRLRETQKYSDIPIVVVASDLPEEDGFARLRDKCGVQHLIAEPRDEQAVHRVIEQALLEPIPASRGNVAQRVEQALEDGLKAYREGRVDEAAACLEGGVTLDPLAYRLHFHLGLLYAQSGKIFDAIRALERAVEINPMHFTGLKNLAIVYTQAGFRNRAAELWDKSLPLAPDEATRQAILAHLAGLPSQEVLS